MSWHANELPKDGNLGHPADGEAWRTLDALDPDFAMDPRNVRFGLSIDGFNPFRTMSSVFSTWPVSITARVKDELTQEILSTVLINLQRVIPNLDSDSILAGLAAGIQSPGDAISGPGIRNASSSSYVPFELNKFPGDEIPIIRGSALPALNGTNDEIGRQTVLNLMDVVDGCIPDFITQLDKPFLMPIEDVFSIQYEAYQKGAQAHHNAGQTSREKYHKLAPEQKAPHGKAEMEEATNKQCMTRGIPSVILDLDHEIERTLQRRSRFQGPTIQVPVEDSESFATLRMEEPNVDEAV
ncbi:hypothetical protein KSP39_PZI016253 [Platanthera zijinensis]|uniref:Uncharacterized protein n=1 Tax=Platanthera zijinensis TaxID=2320716 RepID=A0AAP0G115_9ASPA